MPLDRQVAAVFARAAALGLPPYEQQTPQEARASYRQVVAARRGPDVVPEPVAAVAERTIPGTGGPLNARVFTPPGSGPHPVLLYFHGGGWVIGNRDTHDDQARALCARGGALVVSVDYRLAPEHPFPAALDDARAATAWVVDHAEELGGDPQRVAVAGDSAGANLAAAVCLAARDAGGPRLALQVLIYPVVDATLAQPSVAELALGYGLTLSTMRWFVDQYLPDPSARLDPLASPLAAPDLSGLPPAVVVTAGYDLLRDQGDAYAARLRAAGGEVVLRRHPGLVHGFLGMAPQVDAAAAAVDLLCADVRRALVP